MRVGARDGEFRVEEEAVEEDLSLREKRPIVVLAVVVLEQDGEWDGGWRMDEGRLTLDVGLSRGRGLAGKGRLKRLSLARARTWEKKKQLSRSQD